MHIIRLRFGEIILPSGRLTVHPLDFLTMVRRPENALLSSLGLQADTTGDLVLLLSEMGVEPSSSGLG